MNNSVLKQDVMRRVFFIHTARRITQPFISEIVMLVALVFGETFFVSLSDVYANAGTANTIGEFFVFIVSAFINTHFIVQAMTVGIVVAGVLLSRHLYKQSVKIISLIPFPFFRFNISK